MNKSPAAEEEKVSLDNQEPPAESYGSETDICNIEMSMAGDQINEEYITQNSLSEQDLFEIFNSGLVHFEEYQKNPAKILGNKNLVVCIEDQYYKYEDAIQIMIGQFVYKQLIENMPDCLN